MRTSHLLATLTIASLGFSSLSYAVPVAPPSNAGTVNNGGLFMTYFENLAGFPCSGGNIAVGVKKTPATDYMKPDCKSIGIVLGSFFQPFGTNSGALSGFDLSGNPIYYDYSNLTPTWITNIRNQVFSGSTLTGMTNNNFMGVFNDYLTQWSISNPVVSSQWKDIAGGIGYTGGIVRIGTSPLSTTLSYNSTTRFGSEINPGFGGVYLGWNGGTQGTHIGNGLNLTGVPGYGDLYARNIQAYGNLSVSGSTNLGGSLTINTGSQICLAGSCINNFSSIGGSQWTGTSPGDIYYNTAGKVGIGTASPRGKLDVNGEIIAVNRFTLAQDTSSTTPTWHMDNSSDKFRIFRQPNIVSAGVEGLTISHLGAQNFDMRFYGNITANGFLYSSDRNLKKNITPLEGSLEKILKLNGYSYNWKSTGKADIGVIAQEVETVYPTIVHTNAEGVKSVEYANLIAPLIEAVKTQQKEIESLKAEVANLKK